MTSSPFAACWVDRSALSPRHRVVAKPARAHAQAAPSGAPRLRLGPAPKGRIGRHLRGATTAGTSGCGATVTLTADKLVLPNGENVTLSTVAQESAPPNTTCFWNVAIFDTATGKPLDDNPYGPTLDVVWGKPGTFIACVKQDPAPVTIDSCEATSQPVTVVGVPYSVTLSADTSHVVPSGKAILTATVNQQLSGAQGSHRLVLYRIRSYQDTVVDPALMETYAPVTVRAEQYTSGTSGTWTVSWATPTPDQSQDAHDAYVAYVLPAAAPVPTADLPTLFDAKTDPLDEITDAWHVTLAPASGGAVTATANAMPTNGAFIEIFDLTDRNNPAKCAYNVNVCSTTPVDPTHPLQAFLVANSNYTTFPPMPWVAHSAVQLSATDTASDPPQVAAPVPCIRDNCELVGMLSLPATDLTVASPGQGLAVTRTYAGWHGDDGPFGVGWVLGYDMRVLDSGGATTYLASDAKLVVTQPDGSLWVFRRNPDGSFTQAAPRVGGRLTSDAGGFTLVTTPGGTRYRFNSAGRLTSITDAAGETTQLTYAGGQLAAVTAPNGRELTFTWNGQHIASVTGPVSRVSYGYDVNRLVTVTAVTGQTYTYAYDTSNRLIRAADPRGYGISYGYDTKNRVTARGTPTTSATSFGNVFGFRYSDDGSTMLTQSQSPAHIEEYANGQLSAVTDTKFVPYTPLSVERLTYDLVTGRVATKTDVYGNTWSYGYDASGFLATSTDPMGHQTQYTNDDIGQPLETTSPGGITTTNAYDPVTRVLTSSTTSHGALSTSTSWTHDEAAFPSLVTSVTDPNGHTSRFGYDAATGDVLSATDAEGDTTSYGYDFAGRVTSVVAPRGNVSGHDAADYTTTYDLRPDGQPNSVTDPLNHVTSYTYDADGDVASVTDPDNHLTAFDYDGADLVSTIHQPDGTTISETHDWYGNLTKYTAPNGTSMAYNYSGSKLTWYGLYANSWPMMSYTYDADGRLATVADGSAATATYSYYADGSTSGVSYSDGSPGVTYTYDADGHRLTMTDGTGTSQYAYDDLDRLTTVTNGAGATFGYGLDDAGNLTSVTYPDARTVGYGFDDANRMTGVTDWSGNASTVGYDADGDVTSVGYANGVTASYAYDRAGRLTSVSDAKGATTLGSFGYTKDDAGLVAQLASTGTPETDQAYGYDGLNRLTTANSVAYSHDTNGNVTSLPGATLGYGNTDVLSSGFGMGFTTDTAGNRTRGEPLPGTSVASILSWNAAGRLTSAKPSGAATPTATYGYDGDGLRTTKQVGSTTSTFSYLADGSIAGDGAHWFVYGPLGLLEQIDSSTGSVTYAHEDALGSTRLLTDGSGSVVGSSAYTAWGAASRTGTATTPLGFTGAYTDAETGYVWLRARYYDPATASFLSRDPLDPSTHEAYRYAGGNPISNTDPTGLDWLQDVGDFSAGFGDAASFGLTYYVREALDANEAVDFDSGWYAAGSDTGLVASAVATDGLSAARGAARAAEAVQTADAADAGMASAARSCSVNSFTGDTPVIRGDGTTEPIDAVRVGDRVRASDPQTGQTAAERVDRVIVHSGPHTMVDLTLADGSTVRATDRHPFWDVSTGRFTYATDLRAGDRLRLAGGSTIAVAAVRSYIANLTAYNLTVHGIHTYYAGRTPVLVHNSCGDRVASAAERHGGVEVDGGYAFATRRAARQAASEIAGDLGSNPATIRASDFRGGPWWMRDSDMVIGRSSSSADLGWRDDFPGHTFEDGVMGPHVNVWENDWNVHLFYGGPG